MGIVDINHVTFEYAKRDEEGNIESTVTAVKDVDLEVYPGEFIAILGHNGSGKSTLAKHINAILYPTSGTVIVDGKDTSDESNTLPVRQTAGMVFQNPDNQIIGQVVEEDVGFGPENLGVPTKEIWERVKESLQAVGMYEYRAASPNKLSGGQKQRVSIASVIAMHPKCIILDEPTAMLDPSGRKEVIRAVRALNDVEKITIILITHYMEEVIYADRVFVMEKGEVKMSGTPKEIFSRVPELLELRLGVPQVTELAYNLQKAGMDIPSGILTQKELVDELVKVYQKHREDKENGPDGEYTGDVVSKDVRSASKEEDKRFSEKTQLILEDLTYEYNPGTPMAVKALDHINIRIDKGEFLGLIGHTGSGKSTLVQHLNALLTPTSGTMYYLGEDVFVKDYPRKKLRGKVGLVFQYPEHQLFEDTILNEVSFGPKNLGFSIAECKEKTIEALHLVGMSEDCLNISPFDLSGGQKRRVAIAGVLAMEPEILVLDEPTAGLDPKGREDLLHMIGDLKKRRGITVVLVSHSMEDVAEYADRIVVMDHGKVLYDQCPDKVFDHVAELEKVGLAAPQMRYVLRDMKAAGIPVEGKAITIADTVEEILRAI